MATEALWEAGIHDDAGRGVPALPAGADAGHEMANAIGVGAQRAWVERTIAQRVAVLRRARHEMAGMAHAFAKAVSPELSRTEADTMVAEVLPLLAACRFAERNAAKILRPRRCGSAGRPFWLAGVESVVHRVPFGTVLIIAPANYPLLLPGVQALQALVAGNAVVWKPGRGGSEVAHLFAGTLERSGLPPGLLQVTAETIEAAAEAIEGGVDKVFFTGSRAIGRVILRRLAETLTPSVIELSGCDAVLVLAAADLDRVVKALCLGMRLNGSATCMAPRRVLLLDPDASRRHMLLDRLKTELANVPGVHLSGSVREQLQRLLAQASDSGATVCGDFTAEEVQPILVLGGNPQMDLASADIFAPVLMILESDLAQMEHVLDVSPMALTVSIFGPEREARRAAERVTAGTVLINDVIVPTADPRLPFGGRRESGFGVTRGAEGLLEMTAVKVLAVRHGKSTRHYEPTGEKHAAMFSGVISASHAGTWTKRWRGLRQTVTAIGQMKNKD